MVAHDGIARASGGTGIRIYYNVSNGWVVRNGIWNIIDGFEIGPNQPSGGVSAYGINARADGIVRNCIVLSIGSTGNNLHSLAVSVSDGLIYNCIIYKVKSGVNFGYTVGAVQVWGAGKAYNVTAYKMERPNGAGVCSGFISRANTTTIKNCYAGETRTSDFLWTVEGTHDYNVSEDTSANGANSLTGKAPSDQFVNIGSGTEDLHLKEGADCIDAAVDLSGTFTTDVDGDTRVAPWDVGADEYSVAGGIDRHVALDGYFIDGGNVTACTSGLLEV